MITVFTPTYNRAHLLPNLYESLKLQTFKDFEWLIIDDGSTDNTKIHVKKWAKETSFDIKYVYQENGGKHRAINRGVRIAHGELFFIVDSDDILPKDALETNWRYYEQIRDDDRFAGVCGLKAYYDGTMVQPKVGYDILDCKSLDYNFRLKLYGGKAEAFKTAIVRKFPFPEFPNENFCAESAVWNKIGAEYYLRYFNKVVYQCEFQENGLSANSLRLRIMNPKSAMYVYRDLSEYDVPLLVRLKSAVNYWRFYYCVKSKDYPKIAYAYYPFSFIGMIIHLFDKKVSRKRLKIGKERGFYNRNCNSLKND